MSEWKVNKSQRVCAASGKIFEPGDAFFSALKEEGEGFTRYDYSPEVWDEMEKEAFFSYWKTHLPDRTNERKNRLKIDTEAFYTFFCSLQRKGSSNSLFTYLLALILIRKRLLRLDEIEKSPDGENLIIYDTREKTELQVKVPEVTETAINEAKKELEEIFECSTDD